MYNATQHPTLIDLRQQYGDYINKLSSFDPNVYISSMADQYTSALYNARELVNTRLIGLHPVIQHVSLSIYYKNPYLQLFPSWIGIIENAAKKVSHVWKILIGYIQLKIIFNNRDIMSAFFIHFSRGGHYSAELIHHNMSKIHQLHFDLSSLLITLEYVLLNKHFNK